MARKDTTLVKLGENLRRVREQRGWSQEELAFKAGVHRTYVGGVERGEYNVTVLTLRKFTKTLGITVQDALRGLS
ncbi:MAG: helix-turn-helix transcriptional regulator [Planctomycetota bacterium]